MFFLERERFWNKPRKQRLSQNQGCSDKYHKKQEYTIKQNTIADRCSFTFFALLGGPDMSTNLLRGP